MIEFLPILLGFAVLLPLISFFIILCFGPKMGKAGSGAAYMAICAIGGACLLSFASLFIWLNNHYHELGPHGGDHAVKQVEEVQQLATTESSPTIRTVAFHPGEGDDEEDEHHHEEEGHHHDEDGDHHDDAHGGHHINGPTLHEKGTYYTLAKMGGLRLEISYYIDSLTICMFCMVTFIATLIHIYATGYMHEELHDVTDHEVALEDGSHLHRPGRYHRFFQYLSLFCFSMLGLVLAGNIAMVFVFWELVGVCSYFLIGFYVERKSASNAANKAFIVNRVGDFGMLIGMFALWSTLGTFSFGDIDYNANEVIDDNEKGLFSRVRAEENHYQIQTPDEMVMSGARKEVQSFIADYKADHPGVSNERIRAAVVAKIPEWRDGGSDGDGKHYGYCLLIIAGIGIFCGCIGKSAQFPLHVWLPDAMEGPTPVSALVHSATMVAAGVYLTGRFYPVFVPEALLFIATIGCITLFVAATIAITATDIKRVLAYSTVSQLGYMMMALGVGGWLAGMMHLITHAFFKSLLFMGSGSVIHAVHTNEMPEMGGLLKKMPYTAWTMFAGCLAIAGASIPFVIGTSGYYSKDSILEQAFVFMNRNNSAFGAVFFWAAAGGAAITAFYMFRMWFMTFVGKPRNQERYDHAHESPKAMYLPLVILAVFAVSVAWSMPKDIQKNDTLPLSKLSLANLLEQSRPVGTLTDTTGTLIPWTWPDEHFAHLAENFWTVKFPVTILAFCTALGGFTLAAVMYWLRYLNAEDVRRQFQPIYKLLLNKWWFDELYDVCFIRPSHVIARFFASIDSKCIDWFIDNLAKCTRSFAVYFDRIADGTIVDGSVNVFASWMYSLGIALRVFQTGKLRQYIVFIVVGAIGLFVLISFFWAPGSVQAQ